MAANIQRRRYLQRLSLAGRIFKGYQDETKVPIIPDDMPIKLKNSVTAKGSRHAEKGCLQEITLVLTCLSEQNFENSKCTKEIDDFNGCFKQYAHNISKAKQEAKQGTMKPGAKKLGHHQINQLLARYPNPK